LSDGCKKKKEEKKNKKKEEGFPVAVTKLGKEVPLCATTKILLARRVTKQKKTDV
jgi:hypothetical protein